MSEIKQEYTGTWLPAQVMLNKNIKPIDKLVYAEVASFRQCFASNEWLGERVGMSVSSVQRSINRLEGAGCIIVHRTKTTRICINAFQAMSRVVKLTGGGGQIDLLDKQYNNKKTLAKANAKNLQKELLETLNRITGRSFRTLPRGTTKLLQTFNLREIEKALRALAGDDWHKERLGELSSDYFLRATTIDKFLDYKPAVQQSTAV